MFFTEGHALVERMAAIMNNDIFAHGAATLSKMLETFPSRYAAHEFLPSGCQATWTADLVRRFATFGWTYCGETELSLIRDDFALTKAQRELISEIPDACLRLTLRNVILNRFHSHAVFRRPAGGGDHGRDPSRMDGWATLARPADDIEQVCRTPAGQLKFDNGVARQIVAHLAEGSAPLGDIADEVPTSSDEAFFRMMDSLFASGQAIPGDPPGPSQAIEKLNNEIEEKGLELGAVAAVGGTPRKNTGF